MNKPRFYLFLVFYALAFSQDDQIIKYEDLFDRNGLMYAQIKILVLVVM